MFSFVRGLLFSLIFWLVLAFINPYRYVSLDYFQLHVHILTHVLNAGEVHSLRPLFEQSILLSSIRYTPPHPPHVKCLDKMKQRNPLVGGVSNSRLMYYDSDAILNETPGPW